MIQYNSRININNGIEFYEQDILYDDYLYSGDIDITLKIDYANPGFGVALIDNEGNSIINSKALIMKLGSGTFEIIEKDTNNNVSILFSSSLSLSNTTIGDLIKPGTYLVISLCTPKYVSFPLLSISFRLVIYPLILLNTESVVAKLADALQRFTSLLSYTLISPDSYIYLYSIPSDIVISYNQIGRASCRERV